SPTMKPATSPLTSMGIVSERLTRQALTEFGKGFVVDRRQFTYLEGVSATLIEKTSERSHDPRVELNSLISVELIHRAFMTDRFSVNTIGSHCIVCVGHIDDSRTKRYVLALAAFVIAAVMSVIVIVYQ